MDEKELYIRVRKIVEMEVNGIEKDSIPETLRKEILEILTIFNMKNIPINSNIHRYLDDIDIRMKDRKYAIWQIGLTLDELNKMGYK